MIREALDIIVRNDVRSRKKAHELCCCFLREKYPAFAQQVCTGSVQESHGNVRSCRKPLNKWKKLPEEKRKKVLPPSPPRVKENRVIELHVDT